MFLKSQNKIFSAVFVRMEEVLFVRSRWQSAAENFSGGFGFEKEPSL
jgi:hypothetical protein